MHHLVNHLHEQMRIMMLNNIKMGKIDHNDVVMTAAAVVAAVTAAVAVAVAVVDLKRNPYPSSCAISVFEFQSRSNP